MGVDHAGGNRNARRQAECGGRIHRQAASAGCARFDNALTDAREIFVGERAEADLAEVVCVPAFFMGQIGPFAGQRAGRAGKVARRAPAQIIRKIEELPGRCKGLGAVFLQPQQFRRFHLGRDATADIFKHIMTEFIDTLCLPDRAMIHPDDNVAVLVF